ncbi:hypothetical protein Hanom_Chr01g00074931 [Helianthus anomalus]
MSSSVKFYVAILLILTVAGSNMMIAEACEETWYSYPCEYNQCHNECIAKRGERAAGRCLMADTCRCIYQC